MSLKLFGPFELTMADQSAVMLTARKSQALLVYLAMHPDARQSREKLASLLWSDADATAARVNLRQCLAQLRKAIDNADHSMVISESSYLYLASSQCQIDVSEFEHGCRRDKSDELEQALALYRGDFLEGFSIQEDAYDEWILTSRRHFQEMYLQALRQLLQRQFESDEYDKVIVSGAKLLAIDPLQERVHCILMQCYYAQGRRLALQNQYAQCREALMDQLGLKPQPATRELHQRLLAQVPAAPSDTVPTSGAVSSVVPVDSRNIDLPAAPIAAQKSKQPSKPEIAYSARIKIMGIAALILTLSGWQYATKDKRAGGDVTQTPGLPAHNEFRARPSIAVLPFVNDNNDAQSQYFSNGLSEDLTTDLSRVSGLQVMSPIAGFSSSELSLGKRELAEQLGVQYLLDGSVRKLGDRIRINARLIDTDSGENVWADRYDRRLTDILILQDEVTREIVKALSITFTDSEQILFSRMQQVDPDAYDLLLRGLVPFRSFTRDSNQIARAYFERAIEIDPGYARAHANLALTYGREVVFRYNDAQAPTIALGLAAADRAQDLDESLPQVHFAKAVLLMASREHATAITAARRSVELDPNYADGFAVLAQSLAYSGVLDEALEAISNAKRLNPLFPFSYQFVEGHIRYLQAEYEKALPLLKEAVDRNPSFYIGQMVLAANYSQLGLFDDAQWQLNEAAMLNPNLSLEAERRESIYLKRQHLEHYLDGLRKAELSS